MQEHVGLEEENSVSFSSTEQRNAKLKCKEENSEVVGVHFF